MNLMRDGVEEARSCGGCKHYITDPDGDGKRGICDAWTGRGFLWVSESDTDAMTPCAGNDWEEWK